MMNIADYPSMDRLADLQKLVGEFAKVERMIKIIGSQRRENDVEHSYSLALTCWFLAPKIAPNLDLEKIFRYALAHDIVEIHSGDVFVFHKDKVAAKSDKEDAALDQLATDWPDFAELIDAAREYKNKANAEAKFVYTIDKILPSILTKLGEDEHFWTHHKVTREMHETEKTNKMKYSPEAKPYAQLLNEWMAKPDNFYKSPNKL